MPSENLLPVLQDQIRSVISFIEQGEAAVAKITSGEESVEESNADDQPEINALSLASDCAKLLRAHGTQLSLLCITEPFTPSAIIRNLQYMLRSELPSLVTSTQICVAARYTAVFRKDLAWRTGRVLKEMRELVQRIPTSGEVLSVAQKHGDSVLNGGDKGSMSVTALLWAACDETIRMAQSGVAGHLTTKVDQYRRTLVDVLDELKEWSEEVSDDEEGSEGDEAEERVAEERDGPDGLSSGLPSRSNADTQAMLDDLMSSIRHIPTDDPDGIRPRLDSCLKRLRLMTLLYMAVIKRRLKTLPPIPSPAPSAACESLDKALPALKKLPDDFEEVAAAFYELSPSKIDDQMKLRASDACSVARLLMKPWGEAEKDEFTDWAVKFQAQIAGDDDRS